MDVVKKKQQKKNSLNNKYTIVIATVVVIILMFIWARNSTSKVSVLRNEILIEKVNRGNLDIIINGYGTLRSDKQQLITSTSRATVKEILLKPGAIVKADTVILNLENPELVQEVESARVILEQAKANLRQLKLNHKREIFVESVKISQMKAKYEKVKLNREAREELNKKGLVSDLNLREIVLDEQQYAEQLRILNQSIKQLALVHEEATIIEQERIKQQEGLLNIAQSRLDDLVVRAGIDGVLQNLEVELGQSLEIGQKIALIGSTTDLVALIKIPQDKVHDVQIGQKAIINTRQDKTVGVVSRIDAVVKDNTVNIEIELPDILPSNARPQLNVDATIVAATLDNVTYIKRPAKIRANTQEKLYRVDNDQTSAQLQSVKFGRRAGDFIEVLSGAQVNDKFIVSDLSNLADSNPQLDIQF